MLPAYFIGIREFSTCTSGFSYMYFRFLPHVHLRLPCPREAVSTCLEAVPGSLRVSEICPNVRLHWAECNLASVRKQGDIRPNATLAKASGNGKTPYRHSKAARRHMAIVFEIVRP